MMPALISWLGLAGARLGCHGRRASDPRQVHLSLQGQAARSCGGALATLCHPLASCCSAWGTAVGSPGRRAARCPSGCRSLASPGATGRWHGSAALPEDSKWQETCVCLQMISAIKIRLAYCKFVKQSFCRALRKPWHTCPDWCNNMSSCNFCIGVRVALACRHHWSASCHLMLISWTARLMCVGGAHAANGAGKERASCCDRTIACARSDVGASKIAQLYADRDAL